VPGRRSDEREARGAGEQAGAEALVSVPCAVCGGAEARVERVERGHPVARCAGCGFLFVNPRPSQAARACEGGRARGLQEGWRAIAARRERETARDEAIAALIEARVPPLAPWDGRPAQSPGAASLLEVGCGRGFLLARLRERGYVARGLEADEAASRFARERLGLDVRQALLEERPFADASFDVVISLREAERAWDPADLLGRARSLLKPGGLLVLRYADRALVSRLLARVGLTRVPVVGAPEVLSAFAPASIERLIRRLGFADIEHDGGPRAWIPGLDRCVLARRPKG